jgi:hypothetical protein
MKRSYRVFAVVALSGLSVLFLASAPARAQYRPPYSPSVSLLTPRVPQRALVATPPAIVPYANSYSYLPSGLNLNQATYLNAMRTTYSSPYTPYLSPRYMANPYVYTVGPYSSGLLYNPYGFPYTYNPVFGPLP